MTKCYCYSILNHLRCVVKKTRKSWRPVFSSFYGPREGSGRSVINFSRKHFPAPASAASELCRASKIISLGVCRRHPGSVSLFPFSIALSSQTLNIFPLPPSYLNIYIPIKPKSHAVLPVSIVIFYHYMIENQRSQKKTVTLVNICLDENLPQRSWCHLLGIGERFVSLLRETDMKMAPASLLFASYTG